MSGGAEVGVWELFAGVGRLVWLAAFEDDRDVSSTLCFPEPFCDGAPVGWESVEGDDDGIGEGASDAGEVWALQWARTSLPASMRGCTRSCASASFQCT